MHVPPGLGSRTATFVRHLAEMLVAMVVGMVVLGLALTGLLMLVGAPTALDDRPVLALVAMAVEMTLPMAAWMAYRGHRSRDVVEMSMSMLVPAAILAAAAVAGAIGPHYAMGIYHHVMLLAMVGLMLVRFETYTSHAHHPHAAHGAARQDPPHARHGDHQVNTAVQRPSDRSQARLGAIAGVAGLVIQLGAGLAHPSSVQPNDSPAVFREYAASSAWIPVHLAQFLGAFLVGLAVITLVRSMRDDGGASGALSLVAEVAAVVALAVFAVQMALDGVALKAAVDAWVAAPEPAASGVAFAIADATRSLEKGLDAMFSISYGGAVLAAALAITAGRRYPWWLGVIGIVAGAGLIGSGWMTALTGFSPEAASLAGPTLLAGMAFVVGMAVVLLRPAPGGATRAGSRAVAAPA
jgi:hypothetical protein